MDKETAIAALKSLIANIENDHIVVVGTDGATQSTPSGDVTELTIYFKGEPQIMRVEG